MHEGRHAGDASKKPAILLGVLIVATVITAWVGYATAPKGPAGSEEAVTTPRPAGEPPNVDESEVLVTVNGEPIRMGDVKVATMSLSPQEQQQLQSPEGQNRLIERLVQMKILEQEGRKRGFANDSDIRQRMDTAGDMALAEATLERLARAEGGDARSMYEKFRARFEAFDANQILVTTDKSSVPAKSGKALPPAQAKAKADSIVARLRSGAKFEDLARSESDDPDTAQRGGRTGLMPREALPSELDAALAKLQPGQVSDPIETPYGYFIFQLLEKKTRPFEEVKDALESQGAMLQAQEIIRGLSKDAKITPNPKFFNNPAGGPTGQSAAPAAPVNR
jgi:peptidyl-prolyl cis-trans isomerase C